MHLAMHIGSAHRPCPWTVPLGIAHGRGQAFGDFVIVVKKWGWTRISFLLKGLFPQDNTVSCLVDAVSQADLWNAFSRLGRSSTVSVRKAALVLKKLYLRRISGIQTSELCYVGVRAFCSRELVFSSRACRLFGGLIMSPHVVYSFCCFLILFFFFKISSFLRHVHD